MLRSRTAAISYNMTTNADIGVLASRLASGTDSVEGLTALNAMLDGMIGCFQCTVKRNLG